MSFPPFSSRWLHRCVLALALVVTQINVFTAQEQTAASAPSVRVARYHGDRDAAISFTFDDGWEDAASIAAPMFERYNMRATFFIVPGVLSEDDKPQTKNNYGKVPWKRWREISQAGHEIGNHSWDHSMNFTDADDDRLRFQITGAHDLIRDKIGIAPISFALPSSNKLNEWTRAVIATRMPFTREKITGYNCKKCTVESANALVDKAIAEKRQVVTLFHAVENGYDAFPNAAVLDGHLAYINTLRDRLWVDTFGRVNTYIAQRDAAKLESILIENGITFTLTSAGLDPKIPKAPLTVVIEIPDISIAQATRAAQNQFSLPIAVKSDRILIDVVPGTEPVTVQWQKKSQRKK